MPFDWKAGVASLVRLAAADQWLVLPAAVVVGTLPGLVAGVSGVGWDNIAVSYAEQWQRACTIHAILCGFYLLDLTFDVVVTGLYNSPFVLYNLMFYFVQGMTAVLCRVYYTDGYVAMLLSSLNDVFVLWFLAVTLLHKCCPAVWTAGQRWAPFLLATIAVFLQSCSLLLRGSFALAVCTAVVLLLGCGGFAVGCVRTAISVEASALNGGLSVDEKRCCLLLVSMVVYYVAVLYAFFGCTAFDADTHAFPAGRSLYIYKYISLGTLVLVSYIPWRVSSRAFVENRVCWCVAGARVLAYLSCRTAPPGFQTGVHLQDVLRHPTTLRYPIGWGREFPTRADGEPCRRCRGHGEHHEGRDGVVQHQQGRTGRLLGVREHH